MTLLSPEHHLARLEVEADALATLISDSDPEAAVPACPGWTLRDLVEHVGGVHQWCVHAIEQGTPDAEVTGPGPHEDLAGWYEGHARRLVELLRRTDPGAPAWTFGAEPRAAAFWFRRQALEVAVHRWDAASSRGETTVIDEELATDGLDEVVSMFFPRQVRLGRTPRLTRSLALQVVDGPRFVLHGDGTGSAPAQVDAEVSGPAEALLLLLWRRTTTGDPRLTITGDPGPVLDGALAP